MMIRMLLSHNCTLSPTQVQVLTRTDFATVFIEGLKPHPDIQCSLIENPHWIVEVIFDGEQKTPTEVAELCAQCLGAHRSTEPGKGLDSYKIMLLGGIKTTPARGTSPTSLQPGEWGVDVVETVSPEQFLANVNWETVIQGKPSEQIFKVIHAVG
ncbi:MAG: DUF2656 domain-containing protein [Spirulina sp. SIO3F2]|nr:DUF2656 domain-containing protein [Spirulina sp. SIO3F2]